jgi:hypothetical protein
MAVYDEEDEYSAAARPLREKNYTQLLNLDEYVP